MRRATAGLTALFLTLAQPALACTPPPGWPNKVKLDLALTAETLVRAAATIDIAVAERTTDDYEVGTDPEANAEAMANYATGEGGRKLSAVEVSALLKEEYPDGVRIHYRVVERLKGASPSEFTLNGALLPIEGRPPGYRPRFGRSEVLDRLNSQDLSEWQGFGACMRELWTDLGGRYVVFRDDQGRLLRQMVTVQLRDQGQVRGPTYAQVGERDDAWLAAVRKAIAGAR
jgi:hypothetical protein